MTFEQAKQIQQILDGEVTRLGTILHSFPRNSMGLTPDDVKGSLDWKVAKTQFDMAFQKLRNFNDRMTKMFAEELREERSARRASYVL